MIYLKLFLIFFKIGAFTFGGGYAMLPLIQQEVLSQGWMDLEQLVNFIAVSESTPGPLAVNLSTYIGAEGKCVNSLVSDGCRIEGTVENSILFPGVVVESGAVVRNCVLFKETAVRRGAAVSYLIADKNVEILPDRTLMGHSSYPIVLAKGSQV